MVLDVNQPPPMTPERAANKFIRSLKLPPHFHSVWIRNEWDGDQIKHIIMFGVRRLPKDIPPIQIPSTYEGYEIRKVKLAPDGTPQVPLTLAMPVGVVDKR